MRSASEMSFGQPRSFEHELRYPHVSSFAGMRCARESDLLVGVSYRVACPARDERHSLKRFARGAKERDRLRFTQTHRDLAGAVDRDHMPAMNGLDGFASDDIC